MLLVWRGRHRPRVIYPSQPQHEIYQHSHRSTQMPAII
jgi:hypothetical protein